MINYHLADLVSRLNNSTSNSLLVPITKDNSQFLTVLVYLGVIKEFTWTNQSEILITKISASQQKIKLISKPGKRIYTSYKDLVGATYIVRTSQGIISSQIALKLKLGGELLAKLA